MKFDSENPQLPKRPPRKLFKPEEETPSGEELK